MIESQATERSRPVIIITDDEPPIVLSLAGRSHDELDELHDEVNATLAHLFIEAHDRVTVAERSRRRRRQG